MFSLIIHYSYYKYHVLIQGKYEEIKHLFKSKGSKIIVRCPACMESGQGTKGNHLIINEDGKFACVKFQGVSGHDHRKRIFRLVGIIDSSKNIIIVNQASHEKPEVIMDDVLGRIGHQFLSHSKKSCEDKICKLVRLYEEMDIEADHNIKKQIISGLWKNLEIEDRKKLVDQLLKKKLLPDIIKQTLDILNGTIVKLV